MFHVPEFFTDGSLQFPQSILTRFAAYSIVMDICLTDEQREAAQIASGVDAPPTLVPLAAARTTGNQTIYRSELFAVVKVCEWIPRAVIHTDSQAVIRTFARCIQATSLADLTGLSELDLVHRLWQAVQVGHYRLCKIKSHLDPAAEQNILSRYRIHGNLLADEQAVTVCKTLFPDYLRMAKHMHTDISEEVARYMQYLEYLLQLRKQRAILHAAEHRQQEMALVETAHQQHVATLQQWHVDPAWEFPRLLIDKTAASAWGPQWAMVFMDWVRHLRWPPVGAQPDDDLGVTFVELAYSLCYYAGAVIPCKRTNSEGVEYLASFRSQEQCSFLELSVGELGNYMAMLLRQMQHLTGVDLVPAHSRGFCRSLFLLGAQTQGYGILARCSFPRQFEVTVDLARMARAHGKQLNKQVPVFPFSAGFWENGPLFAQAEDIDRHLRNPWQEQTKRVQGVARDVKRWLAGNGAPAGQATIHRFFGS